MIDQTNVRKVIENRSRELGLTLQALSLSLGLNPTYMQQYVRYGKPDKGLPEHVRLKLSEILGIDERSLGAPFRYLSQTDIPQLLRSLIMEHIKNNELVNRIAQLILKDVLETGDATTGKWQIHPVLGRDTTCREADTVRRIVKTVMNELIHELAKNGVIDVDPESGNALPKTAEIDDELLTKAIQEKAAFAIHKDGTVEVNVSPEEKLEWLFRFIGILSDLTESIIEDAENDTKEEEVPADPDKLPEETPEDVSG